ncbi:CcdB family protein [Sediminicoccus sp. BL-A-41-H5]|uniref:CcdB family protein n=1 Tax=Sediminicoccus sp. BL-A-41-H5 TaxID=3421106 RepID=UPI003D67A2A0
MARFDLYRPKRGPGYLLDIQSGWLEHLPSRVIVPLLPPTPALPVIRDLTPVFRIGEEEVAMMTHYLTAIPKRELGPAIGSLAAQQDEITRALDMLMTGF